MFVKVSSIALFGLEVIGVDVEVSIVSRGLPCFDIVGLPNKAVAESKHRIKMSFQNSGLKFPSRKRIVVNLAPADVNKDGSFYDLPIALGILCAQYRLHVPDSSLFFGELSLDGTVRHVKSSFLLALYAHENGFNQIFVPKACVREASAMEKVSVYGVRALGELYQHLTGETDIKLTKKPNNLVSESKKLIKPPSEFTSIVGQNTVKRLLEISAAGGHNMLMVGPPGAGKTLLAKSLKHILPALTSKESIEVSRIYSSVGKIPPNDTLISVPPFRSPHHTISYAGMIGGGNSPTPGEITLAHRGVLFMDEINEFPRNVLESLRQPLESGQVTVARSRGSYTFPSRFILVAASNPCPCGYYGSNSKNCSCTPKVINRYKRKLSGPILDRIDLHTHVFPVEKEQFGDFFKPQEKIHAENYFSLRQRIFEARHIQAERLEGDGLTYNSEMQTEHVNKYCELDSSSKSLLDTAVSKFSLSARAYIKVIKVAKTISDLEHCKKISKNHIAEAIQYRVGLR